MYSLVLLTTYSEYGIYTTRIRPGGGPGNLVCNIRRRNHEIRPIDTVGGDQRILYIFSPGRALETPIEYVIQTFDVHACMNASGCACHK